MRIFISYGRGDSANVAMSLARWLRSHGYEPWLDVENGIRTGEPFDVRIELGISGSEILIALLSPSSLRPESFCRNELLYAQYIRVPIIPVRLADVVPPIQILSLNYLDALGDLKHAFDILPPIIEQVARVGSMPLREWSDEHRGGAWWTDYRQLDFREEMARHASSFVGRDWLFRRLADWTAARTSRLLLLTADAGVGKSAIAAQLTARLNVRSIHFCSRSNIESCRPTSWLRGVIYQMAAQFSKYRDYISEINSPNWSDPPISLFRTLVADPLRACEGQSASDEPWIFVIDGLDESISVAGYTLASLLTESIERMPDWFRLVVTSRPDREMIAMFRLDGIRRNHIDAEGLENLDDLRTYVSRRLQNIGSAPETATKLENLAAGNFLFAKMTLDTLSNSESEGLANLNSVGPLPPNLGGVYHAMFSRRFPSQESYQNVILPLLNCLIAAKGPLPEELLREASGLDEQIARSGLGDLSQFLNWGHLGIRLFHQSLIDWLMDPALSGRFAALSSGGHRQLAHACWNEYHSKNRQMSKYSVAFLPAHLLALQQWSSLLELLDSPHLNLMARWVEGGEDDIGLACLTGMVRYLQSENKDLAMAAGLATQAARICSARGEYDEAEKWLDQALAVTSWARGRRVHTIALHELGSLYLYGRRLKDAESCYQRAFNLCRYCLPIYYDEAAANMVGLATVAYTNHSFEKALQLAGRAIRMSLKAGDPRHAIAGERIVAAACKMLGRYQEAAAHLTAGIKLSDSCGEHLEKARLLVLNGHLECDMATLDETQPVRAEQLFQQALSEAERIHDLYSRLEARMGLGLCALASQSTSKAEEYYQGIEEMIPAGRHPELRTFAVLGLARITHQRGERDSARALYENLIRSWSSYSRRVAAYVGLGAIEWHSGQSDQALGSWAEALKTASEASEAMRRLTEHSINLCRSNRDIVPR